MSTNRTSMELKGDREIVITRTFRAPPDIVFDAWTRPEHVRRWWAPVSRNVRVMKCDAELRPGGGYRYELSHGEGAFAFFGTYREIARPSRLVYTQRFEPVLGQPVPGEAVVTVTFEARGGATLLTANELYSSAEVREAALSSGMEDGMRETMDLLDELVFALSGAGAPRTTP
jgi:uncharacterized protein YndB with AHSA1/START domain